MIDLKYYTKVTMVSILLRWFNRVTHYLKALPAPSRFMTPYILVVLII